jgi:hypothetical protein
MSPTPSTPSTPASAAKKTVKKAGKRPKKFMEVSPSTDGEEEPSTRGANFNEAEDLLLCRAYVSTSINSKVGNDKKFAVFWQEIAAKYRLLQSSEPCDDTVLSRSASGLKNRFTRTIQRAVNDFNGFYKHCAENVASGYSDRMDEVLERADKEYVAEYNSLRGKRGAITSFKFLHCIPTGHQIPKWNPTNPRYGEPDDNGGLTPLFSSDADGGSDSSASQGKNAVGYVMGATLPRPIGNKKFKAIKKEQEAVKRENESSNKAMASSLQAMVHSNNSNVYLESLSASIKHLRRAGMVERAKEMTLRFVAELDKMHQVRQEGSPPTDPPATPSSEVIDVTTETVPAGVSLVRNAYAAAQQEQEEEDGSDDDGELLEPSGLHSKVAV